MEHVHPLAQLIRDVREATNPPLSFTEISRRSGGLTRTHIHQLANRPMKEMPAPDTMAKLAKGLGVDLKVVVRACLESIGLPLPVAADVNTGDLAAKLREMIASSYEISPEERGAYLTMVTIVEHQRREEERRREAEAQSEPEPTNGTSSSAESC